MRDDVDYAPLAPNELLSQHFSAIAAAGPIVGPILAGVMFGWLPALIWILVGSVLIGGVHDFTALVASIRHKARSIAEVVRDHMSRRAFVLFLTFVWLALIYIIIAFTDVTAASFVGVQKLENGEEVTGAAIASSSLMYLALPIIMGLLMKYTRMSVGAATVIFLPLVGVSIWAGKYLPVDMTAMLKTFIPTADDKLALYDVGRDSAHLLLYRIRRANVVAPATTRPSGGLFPVISVLAAGAAMNYHGRRSSTSTSPRGRLQRETPCFQCYSSRLPAAPARGSIHSSRQVRLPNNCVMRPMLG